MKESLNIYVAECVGTCALVFFGCAAIVVSQEFPNTLGHGGVSFAFGLIVMTMIYAVGNISGAHLNPAVTVGFYSSRRLQAALVLPYICSQLLGALIASLFLWLLFPDHQTLGATLPATDIFRVFLIEVLLTFTLMFVILNVSTGHMEKGIMAGVAVGGFVGLAALVGGPLTGASMNPARSIGPALFAGQSQHLWLYIVAPVLGAVMACPTCRWVQGPDCCEPAQD